MSAGQAGVAEGNAGAGEIAQIAIRITDAGDRKPAVAGKHMSCAVRDAFGSLGLADLQDARLGLEHRQHGVLCAVYGFTAIERYTRPGEIKVVIGAEEDTGRGR